jgi:hypothetical protein
MIFNITALLKTTAVPALTQAFKGIFSAGFINSWLYSLRKMKKSRGL